MNSRNRLLGTAALAFGASFGLHAIEQAIRVADVLEHPHTTSLLVAESLEVLQVLVLILASFFAAQTFFFGSEDGERGLLDVAVLLVAAWGFGLLAAGFRVGEVLSQSQLHAYRDAAVLDGLAAAALVIAALLAAGGLRRRQRFKRDLLLGWAAVAFAGSNLISLVAGVLRSETYTDQHGLGTLTAGLNLATAGFGVAVAAAAIAACAFFDAAFTEESAGVAVARRDLLLAAAAGIYALFHFIGFAARAIVAIANAGLGFSTLQSASVWFGIPASLASAGAAVCVTAALQPPFRRALGRLGSILRGTGEAPPEATS